MLGKLLLIFILALQLIILLVLYVNNPKNFTKALSSIDDIAKGDSVPEGDGEADAEGGEGEEPSPEEGSGLLGNRSFKNSYY